MSIQQLPVDVPLGEVHKVRYILCRMDIHLYGCDGYGRMHNIHGCSASQRAFLGCPECLDHRSEGVVVSNPLSFSPGSAPSVVEVRTHCMIALRGLDMGPKEVKCSRPDV